ncbi:hypothetical protein FisN_1Hh181 [Fistulifera solaris]|uniref:histidine kinase n=1 Tax=Fistulifera solaris TaxID=1519565 RepID=A0A1Z5JE08_FISSO|nr:hypothetical protein FisN_1Hh181 [Fistulifera solaris]|eukprot:GAX12250.1 hypothetical protein FisN_1Hh181 [Fistulifera solaris]
MVSNGGDAMVEMSTSNQKILSHEQSRNSSDIDLEKGSLDSNEGSATISAFKQRTTLLLVLMVVILGSGTAAAFLAVGIGSAIEDQQDQFARSALDLITKIEGAWEDYVTAASWIHGRCRNRKFDRVDFRQMYEYLVASGLDFQAAQFDPNITHDERDEAEAEARAYYEEYYPSVDYRGFVGFNFENSTSLEPRLNASFYFPIHYMEPVLSNEAAIGLDYHASGVRQKTVLTCIETGEPALTDRLRLVQETEDISYGVILMHPGIRLSTDPDAWPKDLASIVIRIPDLIRRSTENQQQSSAVYIFDRSDSGGQPLFLGGAEVKPYGDHSGALLTPLPETTLTEIQKTSKLYFEENIRAANKVWTVSVLSIDDTFKPNVLFVSMGGTIVFLASLCLALWIFTHTRRVEQLNRMKADADAEKAKLILENAHEATRAERELNDFLAHEVRNPVAAAMAACSFVKAAVNEKEPLTTQEARSTIRQDVVIIENALKFVNDLLRNMLDMHRAANKQLKVTMEPTDLLHDVLEPVYSMLNQRNANFRVEVDCPNHLFVTTDRLRLKQVVLNLGRNSLKFVESGYVRLCAQVVDGMVELSIEDSGPGIPPEKQGLLFNKFQESLDSLSQGTGIGLFLCKNLIELMGGEISLDESFTSGYKDHPGTRFVVNLRQPPLNPETIAYQPEEASDRSPHPELTSELPEKISVLFVDDDPILRKLFTRTAKTVAPGWSFREASNGETALNLVETEHFDLIFMDMYMANVEKQLLGTETVVALRKKGVDCRICGLSANDKESEFLEAGADVFTFKPFPCESRALTQELCRVLYSNSNYRSKGEILE